MSAIPLITFGRIVVLSHNIFTSSRSPLNLGGDGIRSASLGSTSCKIRHSKSFPCISYREAFKIGFKLNKLVIKGKQKLQTHYHSYEHCSTWPLADDCSEIPVGV